MQKILVIDDDRDMCLLLKRFLTKHGFEVLEANTAKKALNCSKQPNSTLCCAISGWTIRMEKQC